MEGEIVADSKELEDHLGEDLQSIFSTYFAMKDIQTVHSSCDEEVPARHNWSIHNSSFSYGNRVSICHVSRLHLALHRHSR